MFVCPSFAMPVHLSRARDGRVDTGTYRRKVWPKWSYAPKGDLMSDFQSRTNVRRRLVRPRDNRWIAGVCSGLARRFGLNPNLVRLLFVLSCLLPGPQFLIYVMAWVIIPSE